MLCAVLVAIGAAQVITGLRALWLAADYAALGASFPPALLALFSGLWGVGFVAAAWRLWRLRNDARRWVLVIVGAYGVTQAVWWRLFIRSEYGLMRWPFAVALTALAVAVVAWYLSRPRVNALFAMAESGASPTITQG